MLDKAVVARKDRLLDVIASGANTGYLVERHPDAGLARLPNSEAPLNNGVQVSADRRFIYSDAWSGRQVRKYDRQAGKVTQVVDVPSQPDNLHVRGNGMLIVTAIDELGSWKAYASAHSAFSETGFTVMAHRP